MRNHLRRALLTSTTMLACAATALGTTLHQESFDSGAANDGAWQFFGTDSFPAAGGNPGAWLRSQNLDTFAPRARTTASLSTFVGDYRAKGVTAFGFDLRTDYVDFSAAGRPATLMLIHDNGTPGNVFDDTAAYYVGPDVPVPGDGWVTFDYPLPADSDVLPAGWALLNLGDSGAPAAHTWSQVVQSVSRVEILYGHPEFFYIFQMWHVGLDNPRIDIMKEPTNPADINGDGTVDLQDLLVLLASWGPCADCPADIDGSGEVDFADLLTLLTAWD